MSSNPEWMDSPFWRARMATQPGTDTYTLPAMPVEEPPLPMPGGAAPVGQPAMSPVTPPRTGLPSSFGGGQQNGFDQMDTNMGMPAGDNASGVATQLRGVAIPMPPQAPPSSPFGGANQSPYQYNQESAPGYGGTTSLSQSQQQAQDNARAYTMPTPQTYSTPDGVKHAWGQPQPATMTSASTTEQPVSWSPGQTSSDVAQAGGGQSAPTTGDTNGTPTLFGTGRMDTSVSTTDTAQNEQKPEPSGTGSTLAKPLDAR